MDYQKIACWGDSQTFGARTYGCYPMYLVRELEARTRYTWHALNFSCNGHTARDLWMRLTPDLLVLKDVHQCCLLIGANDVANASPLPLFEEYYRQILGALAVAHIRVVYCGEIPPLWPDGHAFFARETEARRADYNSAIARVVERSLIARLVRFPVLSQQHYTDPVHFNEAGNECVAGAFVAAIVER